MSDSVRPHRWQPTRLPRPWDFPGKSPGVGCHCLLHLFIINKWKRRKAAEGFPLFLSVIPSRRQLSLGPGGWAPGPCGHCFWPCLQGKHLDIGQGSSCGCENLMESRWRGFGLCARCEQVARRTPESASWCLYQPGKWGRRAQGFLFAAGFELWGEHTGYVCCPGGWA